MRRGLLPLICLLLLVPAGAQAAEYNGRIDGAIAAYRLSGVEPDGDPIYQVALRMGLPASNRVPATSIIVSAYLENFTPDTTPILPDLLNPKRTARNLGGFLDGKAILVDDAGKTLGIGVFLNEAFLDNTNHTRLTFYTQAGRASGTLKGVFTLGRKGSIRGRLTGAIRLPPAALARVRQDRGKPMKPLKDIVNRVTVRPHYYGTRGVRATRPAYNTGFGNGVPGASGSGGRSVSPLTVLAGVGAVLSLLIAVVLYWLERRKVAATARG